MLFVVSCIIGSTLSFVCLKLSNLFLEVKGNCKLRFFIDIALWRNACIWDFLAKIFMVVSTKESRSLVGISVFLKLLLGLKGHLLALQDAKGNDVDLATCKGKVLLIVNVASKWYTSAACLTY